MNIYKTLPQYPGYRFGDDGSIWSSRTTQGVIGCDWKQLKPKQKKSGHLSVCLRVDGETKTKNLHRLVLEAFCGTCPAGMECRHLNGNPSDNRICNLKWDTLSQNRKDRNIHGTWNKGESHPMSKIKDSQVKQIKLLRATGKTQSAIAKQFGLSQSYISQLLSGRYRS